MNAKWLLIPSLALILVACNEQNARPEARTSTTENPDNTGINVRDRDSNLPTPMDQSESKSDLTITQKIRREVVSDSSLSDNAKNVKIITQNGMVTLRGPVNSNQEKTTIDAKAKGVAGVKSVNNLLEIAPKS